MYDQECAYVCVRAFACDECETNRVLTVSHIHNVLDLYAVLIAVQGHSMATALLLCNLCVLHVTQLCGHGGEGR